MIVQKIKSFFSKRLWRFGKPAMVATLIFGFASGYNGITAYTNYCAAQVTAITVTVVYGVCPYVCTPGSPGPCEAPQTASNAKDIVYEATNQALQLSTQQLEEWLAQSIDLMVQALLTRLNRTEINLIEWWGTMWDYNLRPALQAKTIQLNTATADQAKTYQSSMDGEHETQTNLVIQRQEVATHQVTRDNVCPPAGVSPGRGSNFAHEVPKHMETKSNAVANAKVGSTSEQGTGQHMAYRINTYEEFFCDPNSNGGTNVCAGAPDPDFYDADIKVSEMIYNKLTIPVNDPADGEKYQKAIEELTENMLNTITITPTPENAVNTPQAREQLLQRRSYLARNNAVRQMTQSIIGQRMPGSQLGEWIAEIRQEAGIPLEEVGENPSYREVMHSLSVDRFNSGKFATELMKDQAGVEMEKLSAQAFYLIQLRDYFELLERMSLVLAVQVAAMVDRLPATNLDSVVDTR
jgi:hypothetical protein